MLIAQRAAQDLFESWFLEDCQSLMAANRWHDIAIEKDGLSQICKIKYIPPQVDEDDADYEDEGIGGLWVGVDIMGSQWYVCASTQLSFMAISRAHAAGQRLRNSSRTRFQRMCPACVLRA